MKHLLVVAYHFPPAGGVPVRRVLRFLRHLPANGWRCTVLTADEPYDPYHGRDVSGLAELPETVQVLRAPARAGFERLLARGFGLLEHARRWRGASGGGGPTGGRLRMLLHETLAFPDPKRFWIPGAVRLGLAAAREDPFAAVFATGYPWSAYVVADRLREALGVPMVLDFRDAWTLNPRGLWSGRRNRALEAALVGRAARVLVVSDWIRDHMRERHRHVSGERFQTLTNGWDPLELPPLGATAPPEDGRRLVISYTGTFNDAMPPSRFDRTPYFLIEAVASLPPGIRRGLRVRLVGRVGEVWRARIRERGVSDVIEVCRPVDHRSALAEQRAADVLLLILSSAPEAAGDLTGKLFEYAAAGRPVLLLGRAEGEAAKLVQAHGLGYVEPPEDVARIAARLTALVEDASAGRLHAPPAPEALALPALTRALATELEEALRFRG